MQIKTKKKSKIDLDNGNYKHAKSIKEVRKITAKFPESLSDVVLKLRHPEYKLV